MVCFTLSTHECDHIVLTTGTYIAPLPAQCHGMPHMAIDFPTEVNCDTSNPFMNVDKPHDRNITIVI